MHVLTVEFPQHFFQWDLKIKNRFINKKLSQFNIKTKD